MTTCEVDDCDKPVLAKGLCRNHYARYRRNGHTGLQDRTPKPCKVEGCGTVAKSKGMCNRHYQQWRTHGGIQAERLEFPERFWSKVDRRGADDCWPWLGAITNGYGYVGTDDGNRVGVHRVSYALTFGGVPDGKEIDHTCHDPATCRGGMVCMHRRCVNPRHLEAVTHAENCAPDRTVVSTLVTHRQRAKTHCPRNHPYDEDNTYISAKGHRRCRACDTELNRARRAAARALAQKH